MLVDIDTGRTIDHVPYEPQFEALRRRLSASEFDAMISRISDLIDESCCSPEPPIGQLDVTAKVSVAADSGDLEADTAEKPRAPGDGRPATPQ
jgi:hypothetical protein